MIHVIIRYLFLYAIVFIRILFLCVLLMYCTIILIKIFIIITKISAMFKLLTRRENMHTLTVQRNVYKETESEYMYIMSCIALHCDTLKENF